MASAAPDDGVQNEPLAISPCGHEPPGPGGFGTGSGSVSAVVVASASMREGPFSLGRFLFGTLLVHCRRRALKSLRYFVQYIAASWDARRLARRLACRVRCTPDGCSAEHPNDSRRSAHPRFG